MSIQILGTDPRSLCTAKLKAPHPLPFVSRRALAKVRDRLPVPTQCDLCDNPVRLIRNREIYGQDYGVWPYAYACRGCGAYVGLHPHTDLPLGTFADHQLRRARRDAKEAFKRITRARFGGDRSAAYMWLADQMSIQPRYCHFGFFTEQQCRQAERIIRSAGR